MAKKSKQVHHHQHLQHGGAHMEAKCLHASKTSWNCWRLEPNSYTMLCFGLKQHSKICPCTNQVNTERRLVSLAVLKTTRGGTDRTIMLKHCVLYLMGAMFDETLRYIDFKQTLMEKCSCTESPASSDNVSLSCCGDKFWPICKEEGLA